MARATWPEWAFALIGLTALGAIVFYPSGWVALQSGLLLVWPQFVLHGLLLLAWLVVVGLSVKRRSLALPLAITSLAMTALPLVTLQSLWGCLPGHCYW